MKSTNKNPNAFTCDDLPLPVVIHRRSDGRVLKYNKEAKRIFDLPAKLSGTLTISKLRLEKLQEVPVSTSKGFVDLGPILHRTAAGKEISLIVLRKPMQWGQDDCYADFFEDASGIYSIKDEIIKTSLDAFVSMDENQIILDWNASAEKIFGWKKKEVIGRTLTEIIIPERYRKAHQKGFRHYLKTGEGPILNKLIEMHALHKKGHEFPVELTVNHAHEGGKNVFYSFIRDISARKKVENSLRESEFNLNKAQSVASIGSWEMYGNFSELYWSDEFYRIHGLAPQSVKPSTRLRLSMVHPKDRAKLEKAISEAVTKGKPYSLEKRIILPDGSMRWVLSQGEATLDEITGKRKVFGTLLDITKRKEIEEQQRQLHQSFVDFQNAIQNSSIVSRADKAGVITYVNENFSKISGYSEKELIGQNHRIINSGHHPKSFWVDMWKTIARGKTWRAEVKNRAKDGSYYWVDTFIMPFLDEKGNVKEFLSIRNDITSRKQSEEALAVTNTSLSETLIFGKMGSAELDIETFNLTVSKELFLLLDVTVSEPKILPIKDFLETYVNPNYLSVIEKKIAEGMSGLQTGKTIVEVEFEMITASGRKIWIEAKGIFKGKLALGILQDVTAKREAERELVSRGKTISRMLEGITDGFFATDRDLNFTLVSPVFSAISTMSPSKMVGRNMLELFPIMENSDLISLYRNAIHTQKAFTWEFENPLDKNQYFVVNAYPNVDGLFVYFKDISVARGVEQELKNANELFRRLSSNVPGMIYNFYLTPEEKGIFPYVSSGCKSLFGLEAKEVVQDAQHLFKMIHPDDYANVLQSIHEAFHSNLPWSCEFRIIMPDQSIKWISGASNPYIEADGSNYWYGFMQDVTQRKLADQRITESEIKNRLIVENSGEGIMFTTPEGAILSANPEACKIFGMTEQEICEAGRNGIVDTTDERLPMILERRRSEGFYVGELRMKRKNGSIFPAEINSRLFVNPNGSLNGSLIVRDISERKRAEEVREDLLARFEKIASHVPGFIYQYRLRNDGTSHFPYASKKINEIYGVSAQEAEKDAAAVFKSIHPEDLNRVKESIMQSAETLKEWRDTYRVYAPSGKLIWVEWHASPQKLEDESILWSGYISDVTERRAAEVALEKSEHDLRAMLNASTDTTFFMDIQGHIRVANAQAFKNATRLFGYQFNLGDDFNAYLPEKSRARFQANFHKALNGETVRFERELALEDGSSFWLDVSYLPVRNGNDELIGVSFNATEITERKLAERALRQSEERFKLLYNNSPAMMHSIDDTGRLIRVSDYWLQKMEYSREEVLGRKSTDFLTEESKRKAYEIYLPEFFKNGTLNNAEYHFVTKSGKILITLMSATSERDDAGKITKSMAVITDISEVKRLEQEVQKLGLMVSRSSNAILLTDVKGRVTWINDGFERLTGYNLNEVQGKEPGEFLQGPETNQETVEMMRQAIEIGTGFKVEVLNYTKAGKRIWLDVEVMPIRDEGNQLTGFMAIESDITNLKNAIQEMLRSEQTLHAFMDHAPMVAFTKDLDGRYTFYNKTYRDFMSGHELKAGYTDYDIFDKDFADLCRARDKHIADTGELLQFEHLVKDRTFLEYKFPLRDAYQKVFAVGGISIDITEKLEAQRLITESEERLRNLADNLPNGVVFKYVVNAEGAIDSFPYVSSGSTTLLGYTPEEILENPMILFHQVDPEMVPVMIQLGEVSRQTLNNFEFEYRITTKQGQQRWVQTRSKPKRLANGYTEWGGITMDITERKLAEEKIEKANERFSTVARATNDVIWDWNLLTDELWWNENFYTSLGYDVNKPMTTIDSWSAFVHPGDVDRVLEGIHNAIESGAKYWSDEYRFYKSDGTEVFIYDRGFIMQDTNGKPYRMIGSMQDVTEQRKAQQELQSVYDELNAILNASTDVTIFLDNRYHVRILNKTALESILRIYGKVARPGDSILEYIPESLVEDFKVHLEKAYAGESITVEREIKFTESIIQWNQMRYIPVFDSKGSVIGVSFNTTDITKRKKAEIELINSKSEYQRLVQMIPVGVFKNAKLPNGKSKFLYVSPRWCELNGVSEGAVMEDSSQAIRNIHADDLASFEQSGGHALTNETSFSWEGRRMVNGEQRYLHIESIPEKLDDGSVVWNGIEFDITERKLSEERLIKTNRLYAVISKVNQMVLHARTEEEVYSEVCRIAIEQGQFRMAWVGLIDSVRHVVKPVIIDGHVDHYFDVIPEISVLDIPTGRGPTGTCVREGRTVFNNNLSDETNVAYNPWRKEALKRGYTSAIALPIIVNDEVIGAFTLYKDEPFFFTENEVELLGEMTANISFTITTLGNERDRQEKENALKVSEERFRAIAENMPGSIYQFLLTHDGHYSFPFITDGIVRIMGLEVSQINGARLPELIHPDDWPLLQKEIERSATDLSNFHLSVRVKGAEGEYRWLTGHSKPKRLPNGSTLWDGVLLDDTDQKKAEKAFLESQQRLQAIFDNTINAIILADDYGNYLEGNPAALRMLGYSHEEFVQLNVSQVAVITSLKPDPFNEFLKEGEQKGTFDLITKSGSIITVRYNAVANILPGLHLSILEDITDKMKAETLLLQQAAEIQKKNDQFLSIAQNLPNGSIYQFLIKPDGTLEMPFFSDGLAKRLGTTGEEIMKDIMAFNARCHPDDVALVQKAVLESAENLTDFRERVGRFRDNDGRYHHLGWYSKPSRLPDGSTIWEGVVMDETEQRESEKSLQFTRFTIDHASDSVFWIRQDASIADFNPAAYEALGYSFEEMMFLRIPDIDPNYTDEVWPGHWAELKEKKSLNFQTQQRRKDGTLMDVEVNANFIEFEGEEFNCAFIRDITERKKAEEKLIESETRFRNLFELSPLPTWVFDLASLRFLDVNNAALQHYGYTKEEFLSMSLFDIRSEEERLPLQQTFAQLDPDKKYDSQLWKHKKKDGTAIDVEVTGLPFRFNNLQARLVTVNDVTQKIEDQKRLLDALKEKDTLIKEIHHRVKNNLQLISSILYIRMNTIEQPDVKDFLEDTRQKIKSIALIHERLLQTGSINEVDISDYLGKLIKDLHMTNLRQDLRLTIDADIEPEKLNLDMAIYCGLIINELVTNSIKHAFANRSTGHIEISLLKKEGKHLMRICDDGSSLPNTIAIGKSGSFGMQMLEVFIHQLGGTAEVNRENGTCYTILFK